MKVVFTVLGVDYNQLTQSMAAEVRTKAAEAIATGSGVSPSEVTVELSQGSIVVDATINPAVSTNGKVIKNTIASAQAAITAAVLANLETIPGLPRTGAMTTTDPTVTIVPKARKERSE